MSSLSKSRQIHLALGFAVCAASIAAPIAHANAQAGDEELVLTLGPIYSATPSFAGPSRGIGSALNVAYGLNSTLSLALHTSFAHHYAAQIDEDTRIPAGNIAILHAGIGANLDIVSVIPFFSLTAGAVLHDALIADAPNVTWGARAAVGADYRVQRNWSFGVEIDWHGIAPQPFSYPDYAVFWFRLSYIHDFNAL